jgi:hypothetical protein
MDCLNLLIEHGASAKPSNKMTWLDEIVLKDNLSLLQCVQVPERNLKDTKYSLLHIAATVPFSKCLEYLCSV